MNARLGPFRQKTVTGIPKYRLGHGEGHVFLQIAVHVIHESSSTNSLCLAEFPLSHHFRHILQTLGQQGTCIDFRRHVPKLPHCRIQPDILYQCVILMNLKHEYTGEIPVVDHHFMPLKTTPFNQPIQANTKVLSPQMTELHWPCMVICRYSLHPIYARACPIIVAECVFMMRSSMVTLHVRTLCKDLTACWLSPEYDDHAWCTWNQGTSTLGQLEWENEDDAISFRFASLRLFGTSGGFCHHRGYSRILD